MCVMRVCALCVCESCVCESVSESVCVVCEWCCVGVWCVCVVVVCEVCECERECVWCARGVCV